MKAELRYYYGVTNWRKLSDNTIIRMYKELQYVRQKEAEETASKLTLT